MTTQSCWWTPAVRFGRDAQDGGGSVSTTIVVANQTLPSPALADAITTRIESGVTAFHVVVPATPPASHGMTWDENDSRRQAGAPLQEFLVELRAPRAEASGAGRDHPPVR